MFTSAGRRGRLLADAKEALGAEARIIATDASSTAPALYFADKAYTVPRIWAPGYIKRLLEICRQEKVQAVTSVIDPEIELLAANRERFGEEGVMVLAPPLETARLAFDKYAMFERLRSLGIRTPLTFRHLADFEVAYGKGEITFPVFIKPYNGSASVGAHRVETMEQLREDFAVGAHDYIIQELMTGGDCDADVYIDMISGELVSAFSKKKIETRIGGANKTISFKDPRLFEFIGKIAKALPLSGPLDMDFFYRDGEYYLSEINPRFGGAYLHAFGAGVDFFQLIKRNIEGEPNVAKIGEYAEDVVMMMYDDVVIRPLSEMVAGPSFTTLAGEKYTPNALINSILPPPISGK